MMVILKEIEFCEYKSYMRHHKIKMIFAEKEDSEELYTFYSTIEVQYCTKEELENGSLSDSLIENLNSAAFFLVRRFYMLRCLFGALYVDTRIFGASWVLPGHEIPHPNQWGI